MTYQELDTVWRILPLIFLFVALLFSFVSLFLSFSLKKNLVYRILSPLLFASDLFFLFAFFYAANNPKETSSSFLLFPLKMSCYLAYSITIGLLLLSIVLFILVLIRKKNTITSSSIKKAIDSLPIGILFVDEKGDDIFSDKAIQEMAKDIRNDSSFDGAAFYQYIEENADILEENVYQIETDSHHIYRFFLNKEEKVRKMTAYDYSDIYQLRNQLKEDGEKLLSMQESLLSSSSSVLEMMHSKEELDQKMSMEKVLQDLFLEGKKLLQEEAGEEEKKQYLRKTEQGLNDFLTPKRYSENDLINDIQIGKLVGIEVVLKGEKIERGSKEEEVLSKVLLEAISNTVHHSKGDILTLTYHKTKEKEIFDIQDNGNPPQKEAIPKRGLLTLAEYVKEKGGKLEIQSLPVFILRVSFPVEV